MKQINKDNVTFVRITKKEGEYRVRLFQNSTHQKDADYFTNDKCDAYGTGRKMIGISNLVHEEVEMLENFKKRFGRYWRKDFKYWIANGLDDGYPLLRQIRNYIGSVDDICLPSES